MEKLDSAVIRFCNVRARSNPIFFKTEMYGHLKTVCGVKCTQGSATKSMFRLHKTGQVKVECLNRSRGLYLVREA